MDDDRRPGGESVERQAKLRVVGQCDSAVPLDCDGCRNRNTNRLRLPIDPEPEFDVASRVTADEERRDRRDGDTFGRAFDTDDSAGTGDARPDGCLRIGQLGRGDSDSVAEPVDSGSRPVGAGGVECRE